MSLPRVLRTATFRLALAYGLLFALSTAAVFAVVYISLTEHAEDQIRDAIEDEAEALMAQTKGQFDALAARLGQFHASEHDLHFSYALADASGRLVAGDLGKSAPQTGWFDYIEPDDDADDGLDEGESMIGLGTLLPGGGVLVVAQETDVPELGQAVIAAFVWAGAASLALAVLGGFLTSLAFLKRLESFNRTAAHVMDGKLGERVPKHGTNDEFDRLADNLNAMLDRIQALMESMRQISNDIAHDLRTPLSQLRRHLESARRNARDTESYEAAVESAIEETDNILGTFSALLRIAQIEAGTRKAGFAEVDLSAVFETIADAYSAVAEDHEQSIVVDIPPAVSVRGDRELLTQMLANLVDNAVRHTPRGSRIELKLSESAGYVTGIVSDNGPGIPEESREKVLRRFFRLDKSRSTSGNGLGLSLVAAVADLHGIALELTDTGPGLTVTLKFPLAKPRTLS